MLVNWYSHTVLSTSLEKCTAPFIWVYFFSPVSVIFFFLMYDVFVNLLLYC